MTNMKIVVLLAVLVASASLPLCAAPHERDIQMIRRHYSEINSNLRRYSRIQRDLMNHSTEGGVLNACFAGSAPRKVVVRLYGCQHQVQKEYYFWNNRLVFVDEVKVRYESLASSKVLSRKENRFYFVQGRLVRWLGPDKKETEANLKVRQQEQAWLQSANEWLELAQSTRRSGRKAS